MAGEPALDKILTGVGEALLDGGIAPEIDRGADEGYDDSELEVVNIIHIRTAFEHGSAAEYQSVVRHRAAVDLDMLVPVEADSTTGAKLRELEADIVAALFADRTLGGIAQDLILVASGGDEDVRADEGARALSIEILFLTPLGDHRTIIGAAGLVP